MRCLWPLVYKWKHEEPDKARSWISWFTTAIYCFQCEMLYGRSFENSASSDWVGNETASEVVKTKISCYLICSLNPNIILTCLQSQTPLYPQSALACSNRTGAVLAWTSWNLSIEPTLMVIPVSYQSFWFSALVFSCTNHDLGAISPPQFPTSAFEPLRILFLSPPLPK